MRVAILSQNARAGDAIGRHVAEKVAYFLDRGAELRVVVADDRQLHPALAPYTLRSDGRAAGPAWDALSRADLVCVEYPQHYPLLDLLPDLADGRRRVLFDYHGVTPPRGRSANLRATPIDERALAGFADLTVCHSAFTEKELCDEVALEPDRRTRQGLVAELNDGPVAGKPLEPNTLLFVGRLAPNKRVPVLIAALADLPAEFRVAIVGPSGGEYESERLTCRAVAAQLGVADRVRFLGAVDEATLRQCYKTAYALVMPSVHEGFCLPVVEAQAHGLPVIAARAGALPETLGSAGLTFTPNDPADLARQVRRLAAPVADIPTNNRVAVVTPAFGDCTGGAERSLSLMAQLLHEQGAAVTVFTTRIDGRTPAGLDVKLFSAEPNDAGLRAAASESLARGEPLAEHEYFAQTLRSEGLVAAVMAGDYSRVIVGPAPCGLTQAVVRAVGRRAVVVPCIHDEPAARSRSVRQLFEEAGGVVYHSRAEQDLAQNQLDLRHPNHAICGTWIEPATGDAGRGRSLAGRSQYLLVCGRKAREKNLDLIVAWARECGLPVVFCGAGSHPLSDSFTDLGEVSERDKRDLMAGATALVHLSCNESLSLVVLEAMSAGVPVIGHADCPAVVEHLTSGGGWAVRSADEFRSAVRALAHDGVRRGRLGREYVARAFSDTRHVLAAVAGVLAQVSLPLADQLRAAGRVEARRHSRANWRREFDAIIERVMDGPTAATPADLQLVAAPRLQDGDTWRVEVSHLGGRPLVARGTSRASLLARGRDAAAEIVGADVEYPIPQSFCRRTLVVSVAVPSLELGQYGLEAGLRIGQSEEWHGVLTQLEVTGRPRPSYEARPGLATAAARVLQDLPDHYDDVTTGHLAKLKHWVKQKLLHNFRSGYVDVISRQQSRFNRKVVEAIDALAERESPGARDDIGPVAARLDELAKRLEKLERRSDRREAVR
ncbi:MAG: glycosyltransferase [Gemmataceae bacterium]|nr:glycosyltransferase [Gemmataceae bacterium]